MVSATKKLRFGGLGLLAFLVALVCAAQAAYPPASDLSVIRWPNTGRGVQRSIRTDI